MLREPMETQNYQSRVKKRKLNQVQPELEMPQSSITDPTKNEFEDKANSLSVWLLVLVTGLLAFISFSIVQAVLYVSDMFSTHWVLAGLLTVFLSAFIMTVSLLMWREWKGYITLKRVSKDDFSLQALQAQDDRQKTLKALESHMMLTNGSLLSRSLNLGFKNSIQSHHSNQEVLDIYQEQVVIPTLKKAKAVLRQESLSAGVIGLVSPNSIIQTLGILWVSLRTLRRIALVFGIRPSLNGNLRLFKMALENLAASSITDLITDEIASQLGGTLGDKIATNTADAVLVASLNQRLGKALIKQLSHNIK